MSDIHIQLNSADDIWYEGDDLHCIDTSGTHYRIEDYLTKWYPSSMSYNFPDQDCDENIIIVGNNKEW